MGLREVAASREVARAKGNSSRWGLVYGNGACPCFRPDGGVSMEMVRVLVFSLFFSLCVSLIFSAILRDFPTSSSWKPFLASNHKKIYAPVFSCNALDAKKSIFFRIIKYLLPSGTPRAIRFDYPYYI